MGNGILIVGAIVLIALLLLIGSWFFRRRKKESVSITMHCEEGTFSARGQKEKFVIHKNNRYIFKIVDGQIVSVKELDGTSRKTVQY